MGKLRVMFRAVETSRRPGASLIAANEKGQSGLWPLHTGGL